MIDSSKWSVLEAGLKCLAGEAGRQLHLPQGRGRRLPRAGPPGPPLRRRRGGDGLRRGGTGGHRGAQGGDRRARLPHPHRGGRLPARRHHLRPQRPDGGHGDRGARRPTRVDVLSRPSAASRALPRGQGQRRRQQRLLLLPRARPRARGHARRLPLPRHPRRPGHGDRQRRPARGLRGRSPRTSWSGSRTCCSTVVRTPPSGWSPLPRRCRASGKAREKDEAWRYGTVEERLKHALVTGIADHIEEDVEEARQATGPSPGRHRGPADGGDERGGRPLRRGEDVPAPGGEERPRHEEGGGLPAALPRGGEARRRERRLRPRRHPHGHGEGRRPRHRQEHRGRRPGLQQLRDRRPGRDGLRRHDPARRRGRRRRT